MLKKLSWICAITVAVLIACLRIQLSVDAVTLIGVMFSVSLGFYISAVTVMFGSTASRFLHEVAGDPTHSTTRLEHFSTHLIKSAALCLTIMALSLVYEAFREQWPIYLSQVLSVVLMGLVIIALFRFYTGFVFLVKLMANEAKVVRRSTYEDAKALNRAIVKRSRNYQDS